MLVLAIRHQREAGYSTRVTAVDQAIIATVVLQHLNSDDTANDEDL